MNIHWWPPIGYFFCEKIRGTERGPGWIAPGLIHIATGWGSGDFPTLQKLFDHPYHLHNQGWATGATWYSRNKLNVFSFTQPWEESYKLPLSPILFCTFWLAKKQYIQQTSPSPYTWATIELHNAACRRPDCKPLIRYLNYDMSTISYNSS